MKLQVPAALLLAASTLLAQAKPAKSLQVLTQEQIDPSRLLPPPPAAGSATQQKELAEVRKRIESRSAARSTRRSGTPRTKIRRRSWQRWDPGSTWRNSRRPRSFSTPS